MNQRILHGSKSIKNAQTEQSEGLSLGSVKSIEEKIQAPIKSGVTFLQLYLCGVF